MRRIQTSKAVGSRQRERAQALWRFGASAQDVQRFIVGFQELSHSAGGDFPIWMRRGEAAKPRCGRMMLASMRRHQGLWPVSQGGATASLPRRGSATAESLLNETLPCRASIGLQIAIC